MIKKNIPGVCMIEFDLGELYSYLELFNKVYGGYEKEVDILLAAVLDVFKTEYSPGGTVEVKQHIKKFDDKNGLKHINSHAFRHTVPSVMLANGVDIVTVSAYLGHSAPSLTAEVYSHLLTQTSHTSGGSRI